MYDGFIEVARLYYKLKGVKLKFFPVYIPSDVRIISVGEPITFDPEAHIANEKKRIAEYLKLNIDRIGRAIPTKKFIPFMREEFYNYYPEFVGNLSAYWNFCAQKRSD